MAINEEIVTGKKFRRLIDIATNKWRRYSFWNKAKDTECEDGTDVETKVGAIKGITTSTNVSETGYAADAKTVSGINQSLTNINTYVGEDGKLHFVDSTGADSVLPFSNLKYFIKNGILQDGVVATPPKAYTTNNNCTTQNGYFLTYVGTSNTGYYCQINGIDLTDIDILIIAATCPQSGQNYWALFDSRSKVISTGKWTYVDVRTQSGISFLRTYYGSLNIYNMFGMKYPV